MIIVTATNWRMHLRHTQDVFEMLHTIGANSQYLLLKYHRLRKESAEISAKNDMGRNSRVTRDLENTQRVYLARSLIFLAKEESTRNLETQSNRSSQFFR